MMAWMRKKRAEALNYIIEYVKHRSEVNETELIKEIMTYSWVSKTTALRYVDDLIFIGRLKRNNNHIKLAEAKTK
jgi:hypothetical protein